MPPTTSNGQDSAGVKSESKGRRPPTDSDGRLAITGVVATRGDLLQSAQWKALHSIFWHERTDAKGLGWLAFSLPPGRFGRAPP